PMRRMDSSCESTPYVPRDCRGSAFRVTGCMYAANQSQLLNYLPHAVADGARIETDLEAVGIIPLPGHRYEVRCRRGAEEIRYRARLLVLGGGTIGTARLLLASRDRMPFLGDQVGRHMAFNGSVKAAALLADDLPDGDMFTGRTHPGMISYEFLESHGVTISAAKAMPLELLAGV